MENGKWKMLNGRPIRLSIYLFTFSILHLFLPGCSLHHPALLTFNATNGNREYQQQFDKSYYSRNEVGEYEIVLVQDGVESIQHHSSGPLLPASTAPLAQVVHIRVLWRPLGGVKPDAPSTTNAVIDWYVRANDANDQGDRLHYRGAGFVAVYESSEKARFVIYNARLELADSTGRLQDPLGSSTLSASFVATKSQGMVASTMDSLQTELARTQVSQASAHEGPPPREPSGP